jgi:hypothetical protein
MQDSFLIVSAAEGEGVAKSKTDQVFAKVFAIAEEHPVSGLYLARLSVALAELPNRDQVVRRVLVEMVEHDNPSRRRIGIHACRRIGRFEAPGLRSSLLDHLADRDPWVRNDAAWAIKEAGYDGQDVREALGKLAGGARLPRDRQRSDADPDNATLAARVEAREALDALVAGGAAPGAEQGVAAVTAAKRS